MSAQAAAPSSAAPISEKLTIIITTSPTPSAPSTELLDTILASYRQHCPALLTCRVVVVIDTFDHIAPLNRLKKGCVTAEGAANFPAYSRNVQELILREFSSSCLPSGWASAALTEEEGTAEYGSPGTPAFPNVTKFTLRRTPDRRVTFITPAERLGFGLAVRSALRAVETPYVWVQQHDWRLDSDVPVESIVEVMSASEADEDAPVRYVCLPSVRLLGYADSAHVVPFPALRDATARLRRELLTGGGERVPLTPLFFWHDKTHVASTAHYLERIFPSRLAMPRGAFIEDHVGQRARNQMKEGRWERWACWLYYPENGTRLCLRHLHGRTWRGAEAEKKKVQALRLENGSLVL